MSIRKAIRGRDDGASAVEFALVVPILLLLVFGMISFGLFFAGSLALSNGVREAARYGVVQERTCTSIAQALADGTAGSLGLQYPIEFTVSRPQSSGGPRTCAGSISSAGTISFTTGTAATVICDGSKPGYDELTVTAEATADLFIPLVVVDNSFPLTSKGSYRCEFS